MTTEQSSTGKRQRRIKQDPQFIFENSTTEPTTSHSSKQQSQNTTSSDLYEPGDIVWSKLGSFPWWPALIYRCDAEGGIYTKTLKTKQQYFVYFYGKYLEYAWLSTRSLINYAGLNNFIENAESAVQQASTKSEQLELANRYQLKVSMKKRIQWDEAIELADRALKLTKDERIKEFSDLLNDTPNKKKKQSKNSVRPKSSRSLSIDHQKDEPPMKKKRGRKPKSELKTSDNHEIEYEYIPIVNHQLTNIPPLSNFELKQIVEGLINQDKTLSFDDAQLYATNKAIEIVYENYNSRMTDLSSEWFYDSILLKYPSVVFKYRSWFDHINPDIIPDGNDLIKLKQWQIALMIQAQTKVEQSTNKSIF